MAAMLNHQHGEGGPGGRLITRYGGPIASSLVTEPAAPRPGEPVTVTYTLKSGGGEAVTPGNLRVTHEKLMHLIVVSRDLQHFEHIHPKPVESRPGDYSVETVLPQGAPYLLFNEFFGADGTMQIERDEVRVVNGGDAADKTAPLGPNLGTRQESEGLRGVLTVNAPKVRRRTPVVFTLHVSDNGKPATALEPFLGAACHVVIISADTMQFDHTHGDVPGGAMSGDMTNMNMSSMPTPPARFGPTLQFTHTFMQPGAYRIWVQFGHTGKVVTMAWNVEVVK